MTLRSFLSDSRLVLVFVLGNCDSLIELCTCTRVSNIVMRSPLTRIVLLALVLPFAVMIPLQIVICHQRRCHNAIIPGSCAYYSQIILQSQRAPIILKLFLE